MVSPLHLHGRDLRQRDNLVKFVFENETKKDRLQKRLTTLHVTKACLKLCP